MSSTLESSFSFYWRAAGDGTEVVEQHRGLVKYYGKKGQPVLTNHKFDFAFPVERVVVELEGGTHTNGRHVRGKGYHPELLPYAAPRLHRQGLQPSCSRS